MGIRVSGMVSGLDTESIVSAMVSAYSLKKDKIVKKQTKNEWKQEVWKGLNTKVYSMYTNVSNYRFSSAYSLKTASISDNTKAKVSVNSDAVVGTQSLKILSQAKSAYVTGGKLDAKKSTTTLSDLGYDGEGGSVMLKVGDTQKELKFNKDSTITDFVAQMKEAGLNASFDEKNQRIFVSAKTSGAAGNFTLTGNDAEGLEILSTLGMPNGSETIAKKGALDANGDFDYDKTKSNIADAIKALKAATEEKDKLESQLSAQNLIIRQKSEVPENETEDEKTAREAALEAAKADAKQLESDIKAQQKILDANKDWAMSDYSGFDTDEKIEAYATRQADRIKKAVDEVAANAGKIDKAVVIEGTDAEIELNGAKFTSDSNTFTVNGLTIEVMGVTGDQELSINTTIDSQGLYDKIKDFFSGYNEVINEMTKLYNAESSSGYEPLTDDEKDAMSETEIEKWEAKIKDALLRRDTGLGTLLNNMVNAMSKQYTINDKNYSLSSFGIQTLGYLNAEKNQHYAFHIDGDAEDEATKGKKDKLMAAINEDPDSLVEFMKQLAKGLYDTVGEEMKATELRSVYTIYNDKEMKKEYDGYKKDIKTWETRIKDMEDSYFKKFAQMEKSLSKLQNSTSSLTGMMGQ